MAIDYKTAIRIECVEGFIPEGGDLVIMKGDIFYQSPEYSEDWVGEDDGRMEGMFIAFYPEQLAKNFKFIGKKTIY